MARLNLGKFETWVSLFMEGLVIVVALWVLGLIAATFGYVAPSIDGMIAAFTSLDFVAIATQVFGTIVLGLVVFGVNMIKDQLNM